MTLHYIGIKEIIWKKENFLYLVEKPETEFELNKVPQLFTYFQWYHEVQV